MNGADLKDYERIQAVINTLDLLTMPPTYDNVNHMLGIYTTLVEVRDAIQEEKTDANGVKTVTYRCP